MRAFIEAVLDLDRDTTRGGGGDAGPRKPRGEGNGPKDGCYWHKGGALLPVEGSANEIVNHAGQAVMLDPEAYDLTAEEIMKWLAPHGRPDDKYSPASEYQKFLSQDNGESFDPTHHALLWKSSKIVFNKMLTLGWSWVIYNPPEMAHIVATPDFSKRALTTLADVLPLLQIDKIRLTLVTDFSYTSAKHPHMSKNKTITFSSDEIKGFAGTFGAALDYTNGKDAPSSNYLYILVRDHFNGPLSSEKISVKAPEGYRQRWGIRFLAQPPAQISDGFVLLRIPASVVNRGLSYAHWKGGLSAPNAKGQRVLYADRHFSLNDQIEVLRDGKWLPR